MDFFKNRPEFLGKAMRISLAYFGIIEDSGLPEWDDPDYRLIRNFFSSVWRLLMMVLVIMLEMVLARMLGFSSA